MRYERSPGSGPRNVFTEGGGEGHQIFFEPLFAANYFIPHTTVPPIPPRSYTR